MPSERLKRDLATLRTRPMVAQMSKGYLEADVKLARFVAWGQRLDGLSVGDELQQTSVRVAEVDVPAPAPGSRIAIQRARLDRDPAAPEMRDGFLDRAVPDETQVAVSGLNGLTSVKTDEVWAVDVQLPVAEAVVAEQLVLLVDLRT